MKELLSSVPLFLLCLCVLQWHCSASAMLIRGELRETQHTLSSMHERVLISQFDVTAPSSWSASMVSVSLEFTVDSTAGNRAVAALIELPDGSTLFDYVTLQNTTATSLSVPLTLSGTAKCRRGPAAGVYKVFAQEIHASGHADLSLSELASSSTSHISLAMGTLDVSAASTPSCAVVAVRELTDDDVMITLDGAAGCPLHEVRVSGNGAGLHSNALAVSGTSTLLIRCAQLLERHQMQ